MIEFEFSQLQFKQVSFVIDQYSYYTNT